MRYLAIIALILGVLGAGEPSVAQQADPCAVNPAYCP